MTNTLKAVMIDDEPEFARLVTKMLAKHNCSTDAYSRYSDDIFTGSAAHYDFLFLDLSMPDIDGVEVLNRLADKGVLLPIIFLSGSDDDVVKGAWALAEAIGLNVVGKLTKPFSITELLTAVENAVSLKKAASSSISVPEFDAASVEQAMIHNEFEAWYQPKLDLATQTLVGAEGLIRWRHPEFGVLAPAHFMSFLEDGALAVKLSWYMLERVISFAGRKAIRDSALSFSINIPTVFLSDPSVTNRLIGITDAYGVEPSKLTFEVTEHSAFTHPAVHLEILTRLRLRGFNCSIDDFGTGYSSLSQLNKLPYNEIKIDRSFTKNIGLDDGADSIVQMVCMLGNKLNLSIVVEGIETPSQVDFVKNEGAQIGQGFYFHRPLPEADFLALIEK